MINSHDSFVCATPPDFWSGSFSSPDFRRFSRSSGAAEKFPISYAGQRTSRHCRRVHLYLSNGDYISSDCSTAGHAEEMIYLWGSGVIWLTRTGGGQTVQQIHDGLLCTVRVYSRTVSISVSSHHLSSRDSPISAGSSRKVTHSLPKFCKCKHGGLRPQSCYYLFGFRPRWWPEAR